MVSLVHQVQGGGALGPAPTETLLPASGLWRLSCPIPPHAVHPAEVCARVCPVPPSPSAVRPRSCLCPSPSLCVCLCVSPSSPLPFPVGLTPDGLGVPGKGAFPSVSPSQPSAHPPRGCVLFREINSVRSALQEFGRGYAFLRAPKAWGQEAGWRNSVRSTVVVSCGRRRGAVPWLPWPGQGWAHAGARLTADQSAATGHTKRPNESVRWPMSKE